MARHLRLEYPGAIYHVTCRTIGDWRSEKLFLFRDDSDRSRFIDRLGERVERFRIWVDGKHQERVTAHGRTEDVSFRRVTEPLPAGDILAVLSEVFQVDVEEFKRRRRCSPLRAVASQNR